MKDFRPISMVGCIYIVILKVMARRFRKVMGDLMGEAQTAFIQDGQIHNRALIAYETVH